MHESAYPINERGRAYEPDVSSEERTYAVMMHLSLLGYLFAPFVMFIAPLVMWLVKKDTSRFLDDHGRETLNFHLTLMLYAVVLPILVTPLALLTCGLAWAAAALLPFVLGLVGMISAARAADRGEYYRYPMTLRFIR